MKTTDSNKNKKKGLLRFSIKNLAAIVGLTSVISVGGWALTQSLNSNDNSIAIEYETEDLHDHEEELEFDFETEEDVIAEVEEEIEEEIIIEDEEEVEAIQEEVEEVIETETAVIADEEIYDFSQVVIRNYDGNSLVDGLRLNGYDYSFSFRKQLAEYYGIENYVGSAEQNIFLLNTLKEKAKENVEVVPETPIVDNNQMEKPSTPSNPSNGGSDHRDDEDHGKNDDDDKKHEHRFSKWTAFDDSQEVRRCSCGKKEYREHSYDAWKDNNDGTESRTCETCGHVMTQDKDKDCEHNYGDWQYKNEDFEYRKCEDCGYEETQSHKLSNSQTSYNNLNNGTHEEIVISDCTSCKEKIVKKETVDCSYGEPVSNGSNSHTSECKDCGYDLVENHNPDEATKQVEAIDGEEYHKIIYTCEDCGENISKTENCISDNSVNYDTTTTPVTEYSNCTVCLGKCDEREHEHYFDNNNWKNNGENEVNSCSCGEEKTQEHNYPDDWEYNEDKQQWEMTCQNSYCGNVLTKSHEHSWSQKEGPYVEKDDTYHTVIYECNGDDSCGATKEEDVEHTLLDLGTVGTTMYFQCEFCSYKGSKQITPNQSNDIDEEQYQQAVEEVLQDIANEIIMEEDLEEPIEEEIVEEDIVEDDSLNEENKIEEESLEDTNEKSLTLSL